MINSKSDRTNTGYKNISFDKEHGAFRVRISLGKRHKNHHIGYFETLRDAIQAREEFIKSLF